MRLFVGIKLNDEAIVRLTGIQRRYLNQPSIRSERADKLHLTLLYIGETNQADTIKEALDNITFAPFSIDIDHVGTFTNSQTVYWVGIEPSERLDCLARNVQAAVKEVIPGLQYRYTPHVTIGRGKRNVPMTFAGPPVNVTVNRFILFESRNGEYSELAGYNSK